MDGGAWQATVHGVEKSQTRLSEYARTHANCIGHVRIFSQGIVCVLCMCREDCVCVGRMGMMCVA